jgi:hypothetical protein
MSSDSPSPSASPDDLRHLEEVDSDEMDGLDNVGDDGGGTPDSR